MKQKQNDGTSITHDKAASSFVSSKRTCIFAPLPKYIVFSLVAMRPIYPYMPLTYSTETSGVRVSIMLWLVLVPHI